jgi:DNA-binding NtrC family response regulator
MERPLALVFDKDPATREALRGAFERHDVRVQTADSANEARELLAIRPIGFLVLDLDAPGDDALRLARHGLKLERPPIVIGLSARPSGAADELLASGGFDVLRKPFDPAGLRSLARLALHEHELQQEVSRLARQLQSREGYEGLIGRSRAMERVRERIRELAASRSPVWFVGEPGTGREQAARTLHAQAGGAPETFFVIACTGVAEGAWSPGASAPEELVEHARAGSIYLDGLPALPHALQERLAHLVSASGVRGVRWLASSAGEPEDEVEEGRLLEELRRGLALERVTLPPLRERSEDVSLLAQHFLTEIREINRLPPIRLAPETVTLLERYRWPGNVRELRLAMEQAVIVAEGGAVLPEHLPAAVRPSGGVAIPTAGLSVRPFRKAKKEVVEAFEQEYLRELMQRHAGNVTAASQQAGMLRSALQRLLRKYALKSSDFRKPRRARAAEEAAGKTGQ